MIKQLLCLLLATIWLFVTSVFGIATYAEFSDTFLDVSTGGPYTEAIYWVRDQGITTGTDKTHFNPNGTCTRAHIITFLWRYDGSMTYMGKQPFADVPSGCYYDAAAHWAYNVDIEPGAYATADHVWCFMGHTPCTRLAAVTYLWKLAGRPAKYMYESDVFDDIVQSADEVRQAVGWAVHYEITKGTSETTFAPESTCTRAQISAFLYRYDCAMREGFLNE